MPLENDPIIAKREGVIDSNSEKAESKCDFINVNSSGINRKQYQGPLEDVSYEWGIFLAARKENNTDAQLKMTVDELEKVYRTNKDKMTNAQKQDLLQILFIKGARSDLLQEIRNETEIHLSNFQGIFSDDIEDWR